MKTKYMTTINIHGRNIPCDFSAKSFNNLNDATDYLFEELNVFFKNNKKKHFNNAINEEIFKCTRGNVWVLEIKTCSGRYFEGEIA